MEGGEGVTATSHEASLARPEPAAPRPAPAKRRRRRGWKLQLWHIVLLPIALTWIYPFLWMVSASFKSQSEMFLNGANPIPQNPTVDNYIRAWVTGSFGEYTLNTVVFSVLVVAIKVVVTALAGYALSLRPFPGKKIIVGVLVASMFVPHGYTIIPTFFVVGSIGLSNSLVGAALAQAGPGLVVAVLLYMGFFNGIPKELREAALVDGAGFFRTFVSVMAPLAKPVTGTVVLLNFISAWNAFFVPLVFTLGNPENRTLGVGMYSFFGIYSSDWTGLAAGAVISVVPIIIVFLFLQKAFVEGVAGAVKA
jgi:raffinose/stachyose/melibiose transport system permease protein